MHFLHLMTRLEAEFKVKLSEKDIRKVVVVGDVADVIEDLLNK